MCPCPWENKSQTAGELKGVHAASEVRRGLCTVRDQMTRILEKDVTTFILEMEPPLSFLVFQAMRRFKKRHVGRKLSSSWSSLYHFQAFCKEEGKNKQKKKGR